MKIGINASFLRKPDSGIGQVTTNFLKSLIKKSDPKDDFYIYLEEDVDLKIPSNFHKRVIKTFYKRDDLIRKICWEKFLLPVKAKSDKCEVFLSLYQSSTVLKKIPHIMLVHDAIVKIFPWYIGNLRKKIYYKKVDKGIKLASKIMTISKHSKTDILRLYKRKKDKVIVNYIDCDPLFKKKTSQKTIDKVLEKFVLKKNEYIFYVGGFDMRKNMSGLIRGYGILWSRYKNKKDCPDLAIAGKFNPQLVPLVTDLESEIDNVCSVYGVPQRKFKLLGFVEQKDLPALFRAARMFCFPSLYEGFGLPVLEAFNSECPVVVSGNSSLKEIANNKNAFIFDLESDKKLAEKMEECLQDEKKAKQKKQQAKKDAEKFDWDKFTIKTLKELKETKRP